MDALANQLTQAESSLRDLKELSDPLEALDGLGRWLMFNCNAVLQPAAASGPLCVRVDES